MFRRTGGFYLDILKDRLYTTPAKGLPRRAAQSALWHIAHSFVRLLAPVLSFTAEEIWAVLQSESESVFFSTWHSLPDISESEAIVARWNRLRALRGSVQKHLELLRAEGNIGSSLEGAVHLYADPEAFTYLKAFENDLRFVFITSFASVEAGEGPEHAVSTSEEGLRLVVEPIKAQKCERCWHLRTDVGQNSEHPVLCGRCDSNLHGQGEVRRYA